MRLSILVCLGFLILGLFSGDTRAHAGESAAAGQDELTPVPVPEPTPLAVRYHQTGLWIWAFSRFWDLAVPVAILVTGLSARVRNMARMAGRSWYGTIAIYLVAFLAIEFVAGLPLRYVFGFVRGHEYGLLNQTFGKWLGDSFKNLGVDMVGVVAFAWVPFLLIKRFPTFWWLILSALWIPFATFVSLVAPIWVDPLFNDYGPMKNKALEHEILDLASRAGISGGRVFEVNKSVDTNAVNAYVKGVFGTKRIVLWDTLLAKLDDREVLAVMGHEMGHYALNHIPRGLALSAFGVLGSLFWTDRSGRWLVSRFGRRFGFDSLGDVAATPLLVSLMALSSVVLGPVGLALSRYQEHEADRFSLDLTHRNRSAARAFVSLQRENLSVPQHHWFETLWRDTHPCMADRIEFANSYHPWRPVPSNSAGPPLELPK